MNRLGSRKITQLKLRRERKHPEISFFSNRKTPPQMCTRTADESRHLVVLVLLLLKRRLVALIPRLGSCFESQKLPHFRVMRVYIDKGKNLLRGKRCPVVLSVFTHIPILSVLVLSVFTHITVLSVLTHISTEIYQQNSSIELQIWSGMV
mgnify:CR=1 FL=1